MPTLPRLPGLLSPMPQLNVSDGVWSHAQRHHWTFATCSSSLSHPIPSAFSSLLFYSSILGFAMVGMSPGGPHPHSQPLEQYNSPSTGPSAPSLAPVPSWVVSAGPVPAVPLQLQRLPWDPLAPASPSYVKSGHIKRADVISRPRACRS